MAIKLHRSSNVLGKEPVSLRNGETAWLQLGAIVYTWTDQRNGQVDRAWWKAGGVRFCRLMNIGPATVRQMEGTAGIGAELSIASRPRRSAEFHAA